MRRLRKKFEKRSQILMLPNNQERTYVSVIVGVACRGLVSASLVFALTLLLADAMVMVDEIVPFTAVLWPSLIFTAAITAMCASKYAFAAGLVFIPIGFFGWIAVILGKTPVSYIECSVRAFVNTVIDRIAFAGLAQLKLYKLSDAYFGYDKAELITVSLAMLALAVSVLVTPAVIKKVRIFYLAAVSSVFIMPVTAYNIVRDNWGFSMFVVSCAALIALWVYDRKYLNMTDDKTVCSEMSELSGIFAETDSFFIEEQLAERPKRRKKRPVGKDKDIESALRLETPKERRKRIRGEKKAASVSKREEKRAKRSAAAGRRQKLSGKVAFEAAALGGPVGAAVLAVMLIVIVLPTAAISSSASGIPYIDEIMDDARVYVTAFLSGTEVDLNDTGTVGALDTGLRKITLKYPEYKEIVIATVEVPYNTPVYLRAWIGEDYSEDEWVAADVSEIVEYRELFGDDFTPEMITESFYEAIYPAFNDFPESSGYRNNLKYGFITERVNVTRTYDNGVLLYMPSFVLPSAGLMKYNVLESSLLPHDAYFDGIWTSKYFVEGTRYSTLSNVTSMKMIGDGETLLNCIKYYQFTMDYVMSSADEAIADGTAETMVAEYEAELERRGITYVGDSMLYRYCFGMTEEERTELKEMYRLENKYNRYADKVYTETDPEDNAEIRAITLQILQSAAEDGAFDGKLPLEVWLDDEDISEEYYHRITRILINYLSENMEYRIEEPADVKTDVSETDAETNSDTDAETDAESYAETDAAEEEQKSAVLEFLTESKTGYCVQYASSLTMMLRSIGIPARYCEGFIANEFTTDFHGNDDPLTRYKCNIYDSDAHAWVEVYYDSIGWVQYEATEPFLEAMYGADLPEVEDNGKIDVSDDKNTEIPDCEMPDDGDDDVLPLPEEPTGEKIRRAALIFAVIVACAAVAAAAAYVICFFKRAKKAAEDRKALILSASDGGDEFSDADMREKASALIGGIFAVYGALDVLPLTGELAPEYTARLAEKIGDASAVNPESLFDAITKEEFGYGMSRRELARTAQYYSELVTSVYEGLGMRDRFRLRYVKRII